MNYTQYGVPDTPITGFAFTGEWRSANETQYHRARHYNPTLGIFPSLDPFEGMHSRPMSLNGYSWVEGRVVNATDASGMVAQLGCYQRCVDNPCHGNINDPLFDLFP